MVLGQGAETWQRWWSVANVLCGRWDQAANTCEWEPHGKTHVLHVSVSRTHPEMIQDGPATGLAVAAMRIKRRAVRPCMRLQRFTSSQQRQASQVISGNGKRLKLAAPFSYPDLLAVLGWARTAAHWPSVEVGWMGSWGRRCALHRLSRTKPAAVIGEHPGRSALSCLAAC